MKHKLLLLFLTFVGFLSVALPPPARGQDQEVSFSYFHDTLAQFGDWVQTDDYGLCWQPSGVSADWAPYTDGYWAYTDSGWTWVSYEDFGGITYHYGRWVNVEGTGWLWVPDYDWGPAWVSWRNSDEYVGWAPLPPEAHFQADVGVSTWADTAYDIGPGAYRFCNVRDFGAPVLTQVFLPRERNVTIISNTVNVTNITMGGGGLPFVGGPSFEIISRRVGRPIPTLRLVQVNNINNVTIVNHHTVIQSVRNGNALIMPVLRVRRPDAAALREYKPARTIAKATPNHGWDMVRNPAEAKQLRETFARQDKGATPATARAHPFNPAQIQAVPAKADERAVEAAHQAGGLQKLIGNGEGRNRQAGRLPGGEKPGVVEEGRPGLPGVPGQPKGMKPGQEPKGEAERPGNPVKPGKEGGFQKNLPGEPAGGNQRPPTPGERGAKNRQPEGIKPGGEGRNRPGNEPRPEGVAPGGGFQPKGVNPRNETPVEPGMKKRQPQGENPVGEGRNRPQNNGRPEGANPGGGSQPKAVNPAVEPRGPAGEKPGQRQKGEKGEGAALKSPGKAGRETVGPGEARKGGGKVDRVEPAERQIEPKAGGDNKREGGNRPLPRQMGSGQPQVSPGASGVPGKGNNNGKGKGKGKGDGDDKNQ